MMDEKRFEVLFYGDVINCVRDENGKEYNLHELISILMEQQAIIDKQELRLQCIEELLELSKNLNKSYREKLIDMNLKMVIDDE